MRDEAGAIAFAEKLLALLDQGRFTATYKFAVLLGLMDLCMAGFTKEGAPPESVTTHQLAEVVIGLYWDQVLPFGEDAIDLRQNSGNPATIVEAIRAARDTLAGGAKAPLARVRVRDRHAYARLVRDVEWTLVKMPLPKLQYVGREEVRFIYEIAWDDRENKIKRNLFNDRQRFPNQIHLRRGVGEHLVRLSGLLRPMLQRRWALEVSKLNPEAGLDSALERHLFGRDRVDLTPVLGGLRELQGGRCFYCGGATPRPQVDHFIPWARVPLDAIENLVVTDAACNGNKCDLLAATKHVIAWTERIRERQAALTAIAADVRWQSAPEQALGVARSLYVRLTAGSPLWLATNEFAGAEPERLRLALSQ